MAGGRGILDANGRLLIRSDGTVDVCEDCCDCESSFDIYLTLAGIDAAACVGCQISGTTTRQSLSYANVDGTYLLTGGVDIGSFWRWDATLFAGTWTDAVWYDDASCTTPAGQQPTTNNLSAIVLIAKATCLVPTVLVGSNLSVQPLHAFSYASPSPALSLGSTMNNTVVCGDAAWDAASGGGTAVVTRA